SPCLRCPSGMPARGGARPEEGPAPEESRQRPSRAPCPPLEGGGEAAERGGGQRAHAPWIRRLASSMTHTGAPARDAQERGEEEGREPQRNSQALQAVRGGLGVCREASSIQVEGPEAEGW